MKHPKKQHKLDDVDKQILDVMKKNRTFMTTPTGDPKEALAMVSKYELKDVKVFAISCKEMEKRLEWLFKNGHLNGLTGVKKDA